MQTQRSHSSFFATNWLSIVAIALMLVACFTAAYSIWIEYQAQRTATEQSLQIAPAVNPPPPSIESASDLQASR